MEQRLTRLWYRPRGGPSLLQPLAWGYGAVVRARSGAFRRGWLKVHPSPKPVVVIGNLTVGGTGKTPLVVWLASRLRERGMQPGIVTRGYGRRESSRTPLRVSAAARWEQVGDEPVLLQRRTGCPTVVAADRVAAAEQCAAQSVDVILCDDGLQHLRLERACEIVVVDGARGFGNGRLLPAGPLREPLSRLERVDLVVVNGPAGQVPLARVPGGPAVLSMQLLGGHARRVDGSGGERSLEAFRGGPVHAVAGIGNPERFFRDLEAAGVPIVRHPFADHHAFTAAELAFADDRPILMTEKDAVRCAGWASDRLWYVPVTAHFDAADTERLLEQVCRRIDAFQPRRL